MKEFFYFIFKRLLQICCFVLASLMYHIPFLFTPKEWKRNVNRGGQWTPFTTFHFTSTGRKWNCMSKINLLFVITFLSRKIETRDQCQSIEGDSGRFSQPSILPLLVENGIACLKVTFFL